VAYAANDAHQHDRDGTGEAELLPGDEVARRAGFLEDAREKFCALIAGFLIDRVIVI
jgi:hypothetical protein